MTGSGSSSWDTQRDAALIRLEGAGDAHQRVLALDGLLELAASAPPGRAGELGGGLAAYLTDEDGGVRAAALSLAAEVLPRDELGPLFGSRLGDEDVRVRVEAAGRLADLARPELRGSLARALADEAFEVRFEAARGMAALRHPSGLDVLLESLDDAEFRFRALGALGELGDPAAAPKVRQLFRRLFLNAFERTRAAAVLAGLGDEDGAAHLRKRLAKRWSPDRAMAAELIGEVRAEGARELLLKMLRNPKEPARGAAARGLGRLGGEGLFEALDAVLGEASLQEDFRLDVLEGLCLLRTPQAHARVREALAGLESAEERAELNAWLEECSREMEEAPR